jgi:hypothetical protein
MKISFCFMIKILSQYGVNIAFLLGFGLAT